MNITDAQADWARDVRKTLSNQGFRVSGGLRNEKIGYKIREHTLQRVPYLLVVGDREKENGAVAVRTRSGEDLGTMSVADFAARLADVPAAASWWYPVHGLDGRAPAGPSAEADGTSLLVDPHISIPANKHKRTNQTIRLPIGHEYHRHA